MPNEVYIILYVIKYTRNNKEDYIGTSVDWITGSHELAEQKLNELQEGIDEDSEFDEQYYIEEIKLKDGTIMEL